MEQDGNRSQNFWQMASITGLALGVPAMLIGGQLAKDYGAGAALIAVCVGNFILWMIGLGIISMAEDSHAIENVNVHLGKKTGIFAALVMVCAFIIWYALQIKGAAIVTGALLPKYGQLEIGIALGVLVALLSLGGLRLIKWVCLLSLPLLFGFAVYVIAVSKQPVHFEGTWVFSFPAILTVALVWLPGIVNLPTFFRFSRSQPDSVLGLSMMTAIHMFFQIFTILIGVDIPEAFISIAGSTPTALFLAFAILAYICINLTNIYFASAGWETIFRSPRGASFNYLIVGLIGTALNAFIEPRFPVENLRIAVTSFIASLGVVLIIDILVRIAVTHRPKPLEKYLSSFCWLCGCIATIVVQFLFPANLTKAIIAGISVSSIVFLVIIFIEETVWSIRKLGKNLD